MHRLVDFVEEPVTMPVAKGPSFSGKGAVYAGLAAVGVAVALVLIVLVFADSSDRIEVKLGDSDFRNINASNLAEEITENGPVPFSDLVGTNRAVWVNHVGGTSADGWIAFFANAPENPDCLIEWNRETRVFYDTCDDTITYPPNGDGLDLLPADVEDGQLVIAIN